MIYLYYCCGRNWSYNLQWNYLMLLFDSNKCRLRIGTFIEISDTKNRTTNQSENNRKYYEQESVQFLAELPQVTFNVYVTVVGSNVFEL